MKDFVGDMLTRIANGHQARLGAILLHPSTPKFCLEILELLSKEGYIRGFQEWFDQNTNTRKIKVYLKYTASGTPVIRSLFRVSKPGRRVYISIKALWQPKSTLGIFVLSTPKGLLVDRDARFLGVGGEVLFGIY